MNFSIENIIKGSNFGQKSFFTGDKQCLSVRSISFSTLLKIKRSNFIEILKNNENEFETFCMIKDRIIFSDHSFQLHETCSVCGEITHNETTCPIIHFMPKKYKIIQQTHISQPHLERNGFFIRNLRKRQSTLQRMRQTQDRFYEFLADRLNIIEYYEFQHFEYDWLKKNVNQSSSEDFGDSDIFSPDNTQHIQPCQSTKELIETALLPIVQEKKKRLTFIQRLQQQKNTMVSTQRSSELEQRDDISSKSMLNYLNDHGDNDKEIIYSTNQNKINFTKQLSLKDQRIKKYSSAVNQNNSEQDIHLLNHPDILSPNTNFEKSPNNQFRSFLFYSQNSKEVHQNDQNQRINSPNTVHFMQNKNILDQQINTATVCKLPSISAFLPLSSEFDLFYGKFEALFNFKNYFPKLNYKEVIKQLNENQTKLKKGKTKKDNLLNQIRSRNCKKNSVGMLKQRGYSKFLNSPLNQNDANQRKSITKNISYLNIIPSFEQDDLQSEVNSFKQFGMNNQNCIESDEIKVELEIPQENEEQTHLRNQPSICLAKKPYFNKYNSEKLDNSILEIIKRTHQNLNNRSGNDLIIIDQSKSN